MARRFRKHDTLEEIDQLTTIQRHRSFVDFVRNTTVAALFLIVIFLVVACVALLIQTSDNRDALNQARIGLQLAKESLNAANKSLGLAQASYNEVNVVEQLRADACNRQDQRHTAVIRALKQQRDRALIHQSRELTSLFAIFGVRPRVKLLRAFETHSITRQYKSTVVLINALVPYQNCQQVAPPP